MVLKYSDLKNVLTFIQIVPSDCEAAEAEACVTSERE